MLQVLNSNGVIVGLLTFLLGLICGHRLSLSRDDRNRRVEIFKSVRQHILTNQGGKPFTPADCDEILSVSKSQRQRKQLQSELDRFNVAVSNYLCEIDPETLLLLATNESELELNTAKSRLLSLLKA